MQVDLEPYRKPRRPVNRDDYAVTWKRSWAGWFGSRAVPDNLTSSGGRSGGIAIETRDTRNSGGSRPAPGLVILAVDIGRRSVRLT